MVDSKESQVFRKQQLLIRIQKSGIPDPLPRDLRDTSTPQTINPKASQPTENPSSPSRQQTKILGTSHLRSPPALTSGPGVTVGYIATRSAQIPPMSARPVREMAVYGKRKNWVLL
jgi:hypothetical protein